MFGTRAVYSQIIQCAYHERGKNEMLINSTFKMRKLKIYMFPSFSRMPDI